MAKSPSHIGTTTTVRWAGGAYRRFMAHCALMFLFSALLYWRGEQV